MSVTQYKMSSLKDKHSAIVVEPTKEEKKEKKVVKSKKK